MEQPIRDRVRAFAASLILVPAAAAETRHVDPARPDGYRTIVEAVSAARAGDTILVEPGVYAMPGLVDRGMQIIGRPGAILDPTYATLRVTGLRAGERFVLAHFEVLLPFVPRIQLDGNAGSVHLVDVRGRTTGAREARVAGLWIRDCHLVTLDGCAWAGTPAVHAIRSRVRIGGGTFVGLSAWRGAVPGEALRLEASRVDANDAELVGGGEIPLLPATPAVRVDGGSTVALGGTALVASGGRVLAGGLAVALDVAPLATAVVARSVRLNSAEPGRRPFTGPVMFLDDWLPALRGRTDHGELVVTVSGRPWSPAAVLGGAVADGRSSPLGELWLAPSASVPLGATIVGAGGTGELRVPLPAGALPRGAVLTLQGIIEQGAGTTLSAPLVVVLGIT